MCGFEGGEAASFRLLFDHPTAGRRVREHDSRQALEARAGPPDVPHEPPRGIEQEDDESPAVEIGRVQFPFGEIASSGLWIQQHREIIRIVDQRLHGLVLIEPDAHVNLAVGETEMRESTGGGFHALELIRVHEEHEFRSRGHGRDRRAPAQWLWPETSVTHLATHETRTVETPAALDQWQNAAIYRAPA